MSESQNQNQELMAVSPNQGHQKGLINTEHSGDGSSEKKGEGDGSSEKSQKDQGSSEKKGENEKLVRKKEYRITVTEVHQMHPYFWGSLKAMVSIEIPGFTIRGIRIVQEEEEEEEEEESFKIEPPIGMVARQERKIIKVYNREYWARICEEVSKAYLASKKEWQKEKSPQ